MWYWLLFLKFAQSRTFGAWKWCSLSKINNHTTLVWISTHSVLLMHVLHDLIVRTTCNRSIALLVAQTLERPYHFGMGDRASWHLDHADLVVTWKKRVQWEKIRANARFSHTQEVWSFERYENETHHTSHVRSWTGPM